MLSVLPITSNGNATGHAWNVSIRHVHPAAAMRSLTSRKLLGIGCAGVVVTHRALVVAERDLDIVTVKTIQWNRSPVGGVPIAAQAVLRSSYHIIELHCAADIFVHDSLLGIRDKDDCTDDEAHLEVCRLPRKLY